MERYKVIVEWRRDTSNPENLGRPEFNPVVFETHETQDAAVNAMNVFVSAWMNRKVKPFRIYVEDGDEKDRIVTGYDLGGIV